MQRRDFLRSGVLGGAALAAVPGLTTADASTPGEDGLQRNLKHSVSRWPYREIELDAFAEAVRALGLASIELLDPEEVSTVQRHGLTCAMVNAPGPIEEGFNRREHHAWLAPRYRERIREVAELGLPNLICFSGNREGMSDEEGLENCRVGLEEILPEAERQGVTICMELLNSKVDHPGYQCDNTAWGVELCERIGSEHFGLLYDIYHMQIMEGDIIRTIRDHHSWFVHYHTGGVPGRNELDDTQELNYRAVMQAIDETGFDGYVGQEFIPTGDPLVSLQEAVAICDV